MNTCTRLAVLKGHTESVKSIAVIPQNQFVIATGSRDGSILIFDTRFNRTTNQTDTNNEQQQVSNIRSVNSIQPAHFIDNNNNNNNSILAHKSNRSTNNTTTTTHTNLINSNILKSKFLLKSFKIFA